MSSIELDEKDWQILRTLSRNARVPFAELARSLGLSDVAVLKRVKRLEQAGIIKGYTIIIDYSKLGLRLTSFTGIDVEPEHLFTIAEKLRSMENVKYVAITSGDHNIMVKIVAKDQNELMKMHEEISRMPGVKRVCPSIVLEVLKEEYL
ncbi:MAG: Lrp/AsnC family transcriptional regulator [Crenarchaeota archaeon]|nr:Lrp/AsnC family transcriptional regulator [Thermoproteota archaeon]